MNEYYTIDHLPGRTICLDGQEYLFFSGTAYLGLPQHPDFQALLAGELGRYGAVFGSSRNGNLRLGVYEEAEVRLAAWTGAEAALTLSSGMMAGQVVMNGLKLQGETTFLYAPNTHPAVWHEPRVSLPKLSFREWVADLPKHLRAAPGRVVIVANSIDAVRSEGHDFAWIRELPRDRAITVVVDDSHGLGLLGPEGSGVLPTLPRPKGVRLLVTASLAKAMGLPGGVVLGTEADCDFLRKTAFFGACSPIPPVYLAAFCQAESLYRTAYQTLRANVARAEAGLGPSGLFRQAAGYPVFYTEDDNLYHFLLERGMFIYSFAYPTADDKPNTRVVISAQHRPEDIDRLAEAVAAYRG